MQTDNKNHDSLYLEVFPEPFKELKFWSHNPMEGEINWLEIKFDPLSVFATTDYLILEMPLDSNQ
jgi:hypothetical protein